MNQFKMRHSDIIEYESYRLTCLQFVDDYLRLADTGLRAYGKYDSPVEAWVAAGFKNGATPAEVAESYLRDELKVAQRITPPSSPFDVQRGVWLSPEVESDTELADLANQVRGMFLGYRPCITDASGVYVRMNIKGEKAVKVGCTTNLDNRLAQSGVTYRLRSQKCLAWLSFGGFDLEARSHDALVDKRCKDHPEGRELFRVSAVVGVRTLLETALVYLTRELSFVESCSKADRPWNTVPKLSRYLRDAPPTVVPDTSWPRDGIVTNSSHRDTVPKGEAVLMLRDEIGQLRIKGYEWDEIASMLKDDGQGGEGIDIDGPALWSILTTSLHQHSVPWPRAS